MPSACLVHSPTARLCYDGGDRVGSGLAGGRLVVAFGGWSWLLGACGGGHGGSGHRNRTAAAGVMVVEVVMVDVIGGSSSSICKRVCF